MAARLAPASHSGRPQAAPAEELQSKESFIMMLYPAMKDLLEKVPSRYELVNVVACQARRIAREAEMAGEPLAEKPVSIAIQEVADGKLEVKAGEMEQVRA